MIIYTSGTTGPSQGGGAEPPCHHRRYRRAGAGVAVDARRHPRARSSAVPRARSGAGAARVVAHRKPLRAHRKTHTRGLCRRARHAVLRCADGVVAVVGDLDAALALSSARLLVSGSAPLPVPLFAELARLTGHQAVERYGRYRIADHVEYPGRGGAAAGVGRTTAGRRADPAGRRRRSTDPTRRGNRRAASGSGPDDVRWLPEPARRHRRCIRLRRLVPNR